MTLIETVNRFLEGIEAGNTRKNYRSQLDTWMLWLEDNDAAPNPADHPGKIEVLDCRRYAADLKRRTREGEISASTADTYYAAVRSFLSWCVDEETIATNPAAASRATAELPEDVGDTDQQFWPAEQRERLMKHVQERAHDALEEGGGNRGQAFRDRALAAMLALTGVRGAEVARDPDDELRDGLSWADVDVENRTAEVLGKTRRYQDVPLPERVVEVLERHLRTQAPPSDEWPVFPTGHRPTLRAALQEQSGLEADELDEALRESSLDELLEEYEVVPPAITAGGVRSVMKRLSEDAGLDVDGEYLKPHGGRRGVGDALYRQNPVLAQQTLRHQSLETTNQSYQDIQAGEVAEKMDVALDLHSEDDSELPL